MQDERRLFYAALVLSAVMFLKYRKRYGYGFTVVFMALNVSVSVLALMRYDTRADRKAAESGWEQAMNRYFDDARMERIYPNAMRQ